MLLPTKLPKDLRDNKIEHFKVGRTYKIPKIHILSFLKVIQRA